MQALENAIKKEFKILRESNSREIYFYNDALFDKYVAFIKNHKLFIKEIFIRPEQKKQVIKIVKKTTPSLAERGITRKDVMQKAQKAKNDEFYTRLEDVRKEVEMYPAEVWRDKCVFCNCDDAVDSDNKNTSAFALYFIENFFRLELKKLICTHYSGGLNLFNAGAKGYIFTKDGFQELKEYPPGYTGSFDDWLSVKILNEQADIVCTNPPFSRAREYWKLLIDSGKKFLIISNETNVKNQPYISYLIDKKVWTGYNAVYQYLNPKKEIVRATGRWFTNLPVNDRPKSRNLVIVPLHEIPPQYRKYDDKKMLLLDNSYIPSDYTKPFAVSLAPVLNGILEKGYQYAQDKEYVPYINNRRCFGRILIQKI